MKRIAQEPRYLKQKSQKESTAWKNYFFGQHEANDIMNEINRMEGIIGDMIRPVRGDYLTKLQGRKAALESDLRKTSLPPPPRF